MHVGMDPAQGKDYFATFTKEDLKTLPTSPEMRAGRKNPLSMDDVKLRQRKSGEFRLFATAFRQDICAHLARIASRIDALRE